MLNDKEKKQYSLLNLVRSQIDPRLAAEGGLEFEISDELARMHGKSPNGYFVPSDVVAPFGTRDLATAPGTSGGFLVGEQTGKLIEKLDNVSVCQKMGATILRNLVGNLSIPKQTGGATSYWIGEGEELTESGATFGQVNLRPNTVGAYVDVTRKLVLQASIDVEEMVRADLSKRIALAVDTAALNGPGAANEPLGILNTTGIGSVTLDGASAPDWGDIVDLVTAVAVDNALTGKLGYVCDATVESSMRKTPRHDTATCGFILEGNTLNGYRFLMSNNVPSGHILFGNWADLIIGLWSGVDLIVDRNSLSKSGAMRLVALQDVDVAVKHPESFADGTA
jgi:HK97 family phage major capsid protein